MTKPTGGQAFPGEVPGTRKVLIGEGGPPVMITGDTLGGMTMRQYYAAVALHGLVTQTDTNHYGIAEAVARAFAYADAMLVEEAK